MASLGLALLAAALAYQSLVVAVLWLAWRTSRVPARRDPGHLGVAFADVRFPTRRKRSLHGWWLPGCPGASAVLLVHGWGRNAERMLAYVEILRSSGFHLLAFDARHHGTSDRDGHASMKKFSEDIRAAAEFATAQPGVDAARIGVIGLSIGGSAAIHAAAHDTRLAAVVTVGAFAHPADAMRPRGMIGAWLRPGWPLARKLIELRVGARLDELAPERHIDRVRGAVLVIHGTRDTVVPLAHAHRLARRASGHVELWVMPTRGHSDVHLEKGFPERLREFLAANLTAPVQRAVTPSS
jgi:pimeloyl-ACP methyl ester carboxylesterase